jgi:hypothetical protein
VPEWRKTAEEEIWTNFENILFGDQQLYDRVTRFYGQLEYNE